MIANSIVEVFPVKRDSAYIVSTKTALKQLKTNIQPTSEYSNDCSLHEINKAVSQIKAGNLSI